MSKKIVVNRIELANAFINLENNIAFLDEFAPIYELNEQNDTVSWILKDEPKDADNVVSIDLFIREYFVNASL